MMDSNGMMFGFSQEFDMSASAGCFYGRLYGGISMDFEASIAPFYVDAEGKLWIGIEAGVEAFSETYTIIKAYASLGLKFHTPNPTYMRIKAKMRYSFCCGMVSGTYRTTFWIPEKPKGEDLDDPTKFPLVGYLIPSEGGVDIPRTMPFEVSTSLPIDEIFSLDNGNQYMIRLLDVRNNPAYRSGAVSGLADYIDIQNDADGVNALAVRNNKTNTDMAHPIGGVDDRDTIRIRSFDELDRKTPYTLFARAHLLEVKKGINAQSAWRGLPAGDVFQKVAYDEGIQSASFTTADTKNLTTAQEIIEKVYPSGFDEVVSGDTEVRIYYRVPFSGREFSTTNRHYLVDAAGDRVLGADDWQQGLVTEDGTSSTQQWVKFAKPSSPLNGRDMCEDSQTGISKPFIREGGPLLNPFTNEQYRFGEGYTNTLDKNYAIEIYDKNDKRLYRKSFEVTMDGNASTEIRYSQEIEQNGPSYADYWEIGDPDINPLHVSMHVSGSDSSALGEADDALRWEAAHDRFKDSVKQSCDYGEYSCCRLTGVYFQDFEKIISYCPDVLQEYEDWLMQNPRPKPISSYGATGDLVFSFETDGPLNWDALGLTFDVKKKDRYGDGTFEVTLGRPGYEVISAPTATSHMIIIPSENIVCPAGTSDYDYEEARVKMQAVQTQTNANGTFDTGTVGAAIFNWTLKYKPDTLYYIDPKCYGNQDSSDANYGEVECDSGYSVYSEPYFTVYHYDLGENRHELDYGRPRASQ